MLNDRLWVGSVATGAERHARTADNPLVVADRLDELAAVRRARAAGDVQWLDPAASRSRAITLGLVPLAAGGSPWTRSAHTSAPLRLLSSNRLIHKLVTQEQALNRSMNKPGKSRRFPRGGMKSPYTA
jgi:hypothetical protein